MKSDDTKNHFIRLSCTLAGMFLILVSACKPSVEPDAEPVHPLEKNAEAISYLGDTLRPPKIDSATFHVADSLLQEAFTFYSEDSTDLHSIIWYGRRLAYVHRYRDAVTIFSRGILHHPDAPELFRHRGHRHLTLRHTELAIDDLVRAATLAKDRSIDIEPDGIPNKLNMPLSNLHFNIYYHLGLAHYLKADYEKAIATYLTCLTYAVNPDLQVAAWYWLYLSYLRSGDIMTAKEILALVQQDMEIIENQTYHDQLLLFKKGYDADALPSSTDDILGIATGQYGISCWYDVNNRTAEAASLRQRILSTTMWPAFGYIAAEADSARLRVQ